MLVRWAQRIQALAQAGLTFAADPFDRERYTELRLLAQQLLGASLGLSSERVQALLAQEHGYPTPKLDIRAAVFLEDRLLFVREKSDGLWSLPGGWAEVGLSASETAIAEVADEAGYSVRPTKLLAVLDWSRHVHRPLPWHVYKLFLRCELTGERTPLTSETDAAAFFGRDAIPPLSRERVDVPQVVLMFQHYDDPGRPTTFD